MPEIEITERLLNDAGGWQTMKQARSLHELGRVTGATWAPPLLQGAVREGDRDFRAGLRIESRTNIENLCSCRPSRQFGAICAHSIAIGLEHLRPTTKRAVPQPAEPEKSIPASPNDPQRSPKPAFSTGAGEPLELCLVLPPGLASSWQKGSIVVALEAKWAGKRVMLPALPKQATLHVSEGDLQLVQYLRDVSGEDAPAMLALSREQFTQVLRLAAEHPRVTFGREKPATIQKESLQPELKVVNAENGGLKLQVEGLSAGLVLSSTAGSWLLQGEVFRPLADGLPLAYQPLLSAPIVLDAGHAEGFVQNELPLLRAFFHVDADGIEHRTGAPVANGAMSFELEMEGSLNFLAAKLYAVYPEKKVLVSSPTGQRGSGQNHAAVATALQRLQASGFSDPDREGQLTLKGEQRILSFFARELPFWEKTAKVKIGSRFQHVTRDVERVEPKLEIRSSGENWFELQVELATTKGEHFSAADIQRLLQSGQAHGRRKDGSIFVFNPDLLNEFQQVLVDIEPSQRQPGLYRVKQQHAGYLNAVVEENAINITASPKWRDALVENGTAGEQKPLQLGDLEQVLRPYQREGATWLNQLAVNGFGGILADEMGLGKTVQMLAVLRNLGGKALIVCPSSLVYNWAREANRFTPGRKVVSIEGANRQSLFGSALNEADLVITSYALLRRDADHYRGTQFQAAVLDEAQHIKNPESQNAQAAYSIRAENHFVLTGTPVENSVKDLWSLMQFLMPGYLGSRNDFRDRYEGPIASNPGGPEHKRLVKRLRPFLLRRRKQDVLPELPRKIEQVTYCQLSDQQRELYTALLTTARQKAHEAAGTKDQSKARIQVLTALLRLRQTCCDLRLLQPEAKGVTETFSGKIEALGELLMEVIDGGHRVLIFSQFVSMLQLLRSFLEETKLEYCYLDGATKNRSSQVDQFQTGEVPIFLISLKAGGVGLNLTAADTVVHFDPWWNPAVEAQATDRVHRMGQEKTVTSYKLIARDTIEEKILALQAKKRQVIEATIESEEPMMQGLSMSELQELLE